jgi:hypothetical protein
MEKENKKIKTGLCALSLLFRATLEKFVTVSEEIKDNKMKMALRGFAIETRQYEHELNSQLQSLRIKEINYRGSVRFEELLQNTNPVAKYLTEEEISDVCRASEVSFDKAYGRILNEYLLNSDLRSMLAYQWKSIKHSFMKMKLLNSIQ